MPAKPPARTRAEIVRDLRARIDPEKAAFYPRFFRAEPAGSYGEGDRFLGVTVVEQRKVARASRGASLRTVRALLDDAHHECRLTGLLILVDQYDRGDADTRQRIIDLYLERLERVNNWDLVDASAAKILGRHLGEACDPPARELLDDLAASGQLWRQRIAMVATHHFIRQGEFEDALCIATSLLEHPHDLIHKAVGWMLREIGKRDRQVLLAFLQHHQKVMPRTMLRYAIEHLDEELRQAAMAGQLKASP